jgi:hypothetical protein
MPRVPHLAKNSQDFENPQAQYRVHNSPPLLPILSQINPVHQHPFLSPEDIFQYHASIYAWVFI